MATVDSLGQRAGTAEAPAISPEIRIPGRKSAWRRRESALVGVTAVVIFLVIWPACALRRAVPEPFLPGPTGLFAAAGGPFPSRSVRPYLWVGGPGAVS